MRKCACEFACEQACAAKLPLHKRVSLVSAAWLGLRDAKEAYLGLGGGLAQSLLVVLVVWITYPPRTFRAYNTQNQLDIGLHTSDWRWLKPKATWQVGGMS